MSENIISVPTELLLSIIDHIEINDNLLNLSQVSHLFHELSLAAYFKRFDFNPQASNISLGLHADGWARSVLQALSISLAVIGTSPEELDYDCGFISSLSPQPLVKLEELRNLTRYVVKLASVNRATLRVSSPPCAAGARSELGDATLDLLIAVLAKGCRHIHVTTTEIFLGTPYETVVHLEAGLITSAPSEWLKMHWLVAAPIDAASNYLNHGMLETCTIDTFPQSLRAFYFTTLRASAQVLVKLSFLYMWGGVADFTTLLDYLNLPCLCSLGLTYCDVHHDSMVNFLARHPHITSLEYLYLRYPNSTPPMSSPTCEQLTTLITSPEHILKFFPPVSKMPLLENLTIKLENHTAFAALEEMFWHISSRVAPITLTLQTGLGLGVVARLVATFDNPSSLNAATRPEAKLFAVESLTIDNGALGLSDDLLVRIPAWVGLFPRLKELSLRSGTDRERSRLIIPKAMEAPLGGSYAKIVKNKCPKLQKISYIHLTEWTHCYGDS